MILKNHFFIVLIEYGIFATLLFCVCLIIQRENNTIISTGSAERRHVMRHTPFD